MSTLIPGNENEICEPVEITDKMNLSERIFTDNVLKELKWLGVTGRKVDVLRGVCDGLGNVSISERMFVKDKTIKFHITELNQKLGCVNRMELMVWVFEEYLK